MYESGLIGKLRLIPKFYNYWETNNYNAHLRNISRSKNNRIMKFDQLVEYNITNIFLEKSYTKYDRETSPGRFSKKSQNWVYLWINSLMYSLLLLFVQVKDFQNMLKLRCWPLAFKSKRGMELVSLLHFLYDFWRKIFLILHDNS